jgi:hypothetical protein
MFLSSTLSFLQAMMTWLAASRQGQSKQQCRLWPSLVMLEVTRLASPRLWKMQQLVSISSYAAAAATRHVSTMFWCGSFLQVAHTLCSASAARILCGNSSAREVSWRQICRGACHCHLL